jgi:predicted neuraminidase
MIKKLVHNLFAKSRRIYIRAGAFNHCSTVCAHQDGVLVAWYAGVGECRDDQSVHVVYVNGDHQSIPLRIGDKTGNPVLIPVDRNKAILLWSKFEDIAPMRSIVERWKYCSLWTVNVNYHNGRISLSGTSKQIAGPEQHLLGRCNPIKYGDQYLLPLYDEMGRQGVIFRGKGQDFECIGRLGKDMIQPTLWVGQWKDRIHSLSRNFMNKTQFKARKSYSDDGGETWSDPEPTTIPNRNSSLHVFRWNGRNMILWNNTPLTQRKDMTLGILDGMEPKTVCVLEDYGAYPSICADNNGDLNMTYTSRDRAIIHHTWNHKHFKKMLKSSGI